MKSVKIPRLFRVLKERIHGHLEAHIRDARKKEEKDKIRMSEKEDCSQSSD